MRHSAEIYEKLQLFVWKTDTTKKSSPNPQKSSNKEFILIIVDNLQ